MKFFYLAAGALCAITGVEAVTSSTIICSACPPPSSTNDLVTRSAVPTSSCTGPSFSIITNTASSAQYQSTYASSGVVPTGSGSPAPTGVVPVTGGSSKVATNMAGFLVVAVGASFLF